MAPDNSACEGVTTTTLAMQRNIMANERTFSARLRTGLALVVAAIVSVAMLFHE